jgi:hypothetical protein
MVAGLAVLSWCIGTGAAEAAALGYTFDVTTFYQFGGSNSAGTITASPDTGFLTVTNNGTTTFTGTLTLSGTSPIAGAPFCPPLVGGVGVANDSFTGTLAPGDSRTFALSPDSSNCGGFNNPNGANFSMAGTVTLGLNTEAVSLSVDDSGIHSGVPRTSLCDSVSTDAFVLQGGSPTGCDNGDDFETTQTPGAFQFSQAQGAFACPLSQGFWKNHSNAWLVTFLTLGSQTYSKTELQAILATPVKGDASLILAHQLIAALLNIANGSDSTVDAIVATVQDANALLSTFSGKLPYNVTPSSATGQAMVNDAAVLDNYNDGLLTPSCNQ